MTDRYAMPGLAVGLPSHNESPPMDGSASDVCVPAPPKPYLSYWLDLDEVDTHRATYIHEHNRHDGSPYLLLSVPREQWATLGRPGTLEVHIIAKEN